MEGLAWEAIFAAGTFFFLGAISPGPSVMVVIRNTILVGALKVLLVLLATVLALEYMLAVPYLA